MKAAITILFLFFNIGCLAQNTFLNPGVEQQKFNNSIEIYNDSTFSLTIDSLIILQKNGVFKPFNNAEIKSNNSKANHWIHFKMATNQRCFLELDNPRLNKVSFFEVINQIIVKEIHTGDSAAFETRQIPYFNWVFALNSTQQNIDYFILINKEYESLAVSIQLIPEKEFLSKSQNKYILWGLLFGLTILIILLNTFIWLATRDVIFIYFLGVITTSAIHILGATGLGFQYIWPQFPVINSWFPQTFSLWINLIFQLVFMQLFIGQTPQNSKIYFWIRSFINCIIFALAMFVFLHLTGIIKKEIFSLLLVITLIFNLLMIPFSIYSIFERIKKRENIILFFTVVTVFKAIVLFIYLFNFIFPFTKFGALDVVVYDFIFDLIILAIGVIYFTFSKYRLQNDALLTSLHLKEQGQAQLVINALEIERSRIAEDLYDDVGAMLSTAIGCISTILRKGEKHQQPPLLAEAQKLLQRAVENLRLASHNLMPKNFAKLGLSKSIEETILKLNQTSEIHFKFIKVGEEKRIEQAKEIQIFRIASELFNDILKNSMATNATIQLIYSKNSLTLMAEDNGTGEPLHNNLTSKVDFINGDLSIDFGPNGLAVIIKIPY